MNDEQLRLKYPRGLTAREVVEAGKKGIPGNLAGSVSLQGPTLQTVALKNIDFAIGCAALVPILYLQMADAACRTALELEKVWSPADPVLPHKKS